MKTGMLLTAEIVDTVAEQLQKFQLSQLVVDPVMVSRTGAQLIDERAIDSLRSRLIPLALVVTPNRYEAQILSGLEVNSLEEMKAAAKAIYQYGCKTVLVKGGGMKGELQAVDVWFDGDRWEILQTERVDTSNTHGTGCTLSAAIAANLALGQAPLLAVKNAKEYVTNALKYALDIGQGTGPVGHFFPLLI